MKFTSLICAFGLLALISCGRSSTGGSDPGIETGSAQLGAGEYSVSCFYNFQASGGGTPVYTIANISLGANNTGSNEVGLYSDDNCSTLAQPLFTLSILEWEDVNIGTHKAIRMVQDNGDGTTYEYWIPHIAQNGLLYFNLGGADNSTSGPYSSIPGEVVMTEFEASPATRGVPVSR